MKHKVLIKLYFIIRPTNTTPRYLLKRNKNIWPHKNLYVNVYGSFILTKNYKEPQDRFIGKRRNSVEFSPAGTSSGEKIKPIETRSHRETLPVHAAK